MTGVYTRVPVCNSEKDGQTQFIRIIMILKFKSQLKGKKKLKVIQGIAQ